MITINDIKELKNKLEAFEQSEEKFNKYLEALDNGNAEVDYEFEDQHTDKEMEMLEALENHIYTISRGKLTKEKMHEMYIFGDTEKVVATSKKLIHSL